MNTQIYEEAAEWLVDFRTGDIDDEGRRRFDAWARTSPEHLRAYLELAALWDEAPKLDAKREFDTETLMARATAHTPVVAFAGAAHAGAVHAGAAHAGAVQTGAVHTGAAHAGAADVAAEETASARRTPSGRRMWLAAAVALFAVAVGALVSVRSFHGTTYRTSIAEHRSIVLEDGSTIELDAGSAVRVRYAESLRAIDLLRGQALFRVAKDPGRPFVVSSDGVRVRAIGTQFDVHKKRSGTVVTVLEGSVALLRKGGSGMPEPTVSSNAPAAVSAPTSKDRAGSLEDSLVLSAGQQAVLNAQSSSGALEADVTAATAWTRRQFVFESTPLGDVVEEFNRHNRRRLVLNDIALADFRITGVFSSTNSDLLIRFLRARPEILVTETEREIQVSRR